MDAKVAQSLVQLMEHVVATGGTGMRAAVVGYRVAGKTGTAWKSYAGGYSTDHYMAVFAGVAPATHPKLATVVVIDEPGGSLFYAADVAAPVFSNVIVRRAAPDGYSARRPAERAGGDAGAGRRGAMSELPQYLRSQTLAQPLEPLAPLAPPRGAASVRVADLTLDSREVRAGGAFVALRGQARHGLEFVPQACAQGASAVLWEPGDGVEAPRLPDGVVGVPVPELAARLGLIADRFFGAPSSSLRICAFTGTNGKTTCAYLLAQSLQQLGSAAAYIGTLGAGRIGALRALAHTTPDVISVHRLLAQLLADGVRDVAIEVSSHALDQHRVARRALAHRSVHEPHARSPGLPSHDGRLRRSQGAAVRVARDCARWSSTSATTSAAGWRSGCGTTPA